MYYLNTAQMLSLRVPWQQKREELKMWLQELPGVGEMTREFFSYFSTWSLMMDLMVWGDLVLPEWEMVVRMMALQCSVGGFYMCYVRPKRIRIEYCRTELEGMMMVGMDVMAHQLPLYYLTRRGECRRPATAVEFMGTLVPFLLYTSIHDVERRYKLGGVDMMIIAGMTSLMVMGGWW